MQTISVIGLGKLGSPLLATIANRGFNVIGLDVNQSVVDLISNAKPPVDEPQLAQLLKKNRAKITATTDYFEVINKSDITFIIVPTPNTKNGAFSNEYVVSAVNKIGKVLATKDKFHLVVVTSTIMPRSMELEIIPTLEKSSGKRVNRDFGICYNPEFIALGSVIDNLLNPDFVLIGESDKNSGEILESFYLRFCINKPRVVRMNFVNAEIAKIALNSYITTKISFANTLAQICEKVPGGDVDLVTSAIGQDSRVGTKYLKGALPYGGPCFPRDNRAFSYFANQAGTSAPIAQATDLINQNFTKEVTNIISKAAKAVGTKIAILGLAYKLNTDVAQESAGVNIANRLSQKKVKVFAWDPQANQNARLYLSKKVKIAKNLGECIDQAGVIVIATPWDQFRNLKIKRGDKKPILVDCWRILDPVKYQKVANYKTVGVGDLAF